MCRRIDFEASHFFALPGLTPEQNRERFGPVAAPHGHNYMLFVEVAGEVNPATGMVLNIKDVDDLIERLIVTQLDHKCLNLDHPAFRLRLPTTENIALFVWAQLSGVVEKCRLVGVRVQESESLWADYRGQQEEKGPMVTLTRAYDFSASHRLHEPNLSDAENIELYGKCNNPNGHGHNYRVEVTVAGVPSPVTGMVVDLEQVDRIVGEEIIERYGFKHLNTDVADLRGLNPTSENVVRAIHDRLKPRFADGARLHRVRLYETPKSWFEYGAPE